jgi:hypothetical protein
MEWSILSNELGHPTWEPSALVRSPPHEPIKWLET